MTEILCPKCKAPNRDTAKYCAECGAPLLSGLPPKPGATDSARRPQAAATLVGVTLVNRYQIEDELGRGGFGAVYRATDLRLDRICAVKENLDVSEEAQRQFSREATVLANLYHPHLPRVTDHFSLPDQGQYLVMDFVEGMDLSNMIGASQPIPVEQAVTWISQVLDALEYMHNQVPPILHRDIKPANIRVTPTGKAMLVDFGLVKIYDPKLKTTMGARAITPGYAPPEQYGHGSTDVRTDIYALGATLYALLTRIDPLESVQRMLGERMPAAHEADASIPQAIGKVIERAMALEQGQRYQSAADFKAALQDALQAIKAAAAPATRVVEPPETRAAVSFQTIAVAPEPPVSAAGASTAAPVAKSPQAKGGLSKRWLIVGAGLAAAAILCLAAVGALIFLTGDGEDKATSTPLAQAVTEAPTIVVTATPDQGLIATQQAQQTAAAQATANEAAKATQTAMARATSTARAAGTVTAQAAIKATDQALANYLDSITANKALVYGPRDGLLVHDADGYIEASPSTQAVRSFVAQVEVKNPYPPSDGNWRHGLVFRSEGGNKQFRLIFNAEKEWTLTLNTGSADGKLIQEGTIPNFKVDRGETNLIRLIAKDDRGWLYVNDVFVTELDLSGRYAGSIYVATLGGEIPGEMTAYMGFSVWSVR
ncbi:MAG: protein kinase [Anaerolineales bacterium]|nr:protein kinase [Anaerolineales bacterium]